MKVMTISTGSIGNCYLVEDYGNYVVLDCGVSFKDITHNKNFPSFKSSSFKTNSSSTTLIISFIS